MSDEIKPSGSQVYKAVSNYIHNDPNFKDNLDKIIREVVERQVEQKIYNLFESNYVVRRVENALTSYIDKNIHPKPRFYSKESFAMYLDESIQKNIKEILLEKFEIDISKKDK